MNCGLIIRVREVILRRDRSRPLRFGNGRRWLRCVMRGGLALKLDVLYLSCRIPTGSKRREQEKVAQEIESDRGQPPLHCRAKKVWLRLPASELCCARIDGEAGRVDLQPAP